MTVLKPIPSVSVTSQIRYVVTTSVSKVISLFKIASGAVRANILYKSLNKTVNPHKPQCSLCSLHRHWCPIARSLPYQYLHRHFLPQHTTYAISVHHESRTWTRGETMCHTHRPRVSVGRCRNEAKADGPTILCPETTDVGGPGLMAGLRQYWGRPVTCNQAKCFEIRGRSIWTRVMASIRCFSSSFS